MSEIVLDLLKKHNIDYKISGKDFVIRCLNPDHEDINPSFRVDRTSGIAHCFSCGYKVNIFKHFGVLTNNASIRVAKLKQKLKDLYTDFNGVDFPYDKVPLNRVFRGISTSTLREFEAFYTRGREDLIDRAIFPIKDIRGRITGYVCRHMLSNGNPRYLIYPSEAHLPVFPEQLKIKTNTLVLVEGMLDLLNLYDKGLKNVACTFGTSTLFKDTAIKLLPFRGQGITKIYLMFDGDVPGQDAMDKLIPLIQEADYLVEKIKLPDDTDPGDLSQEDVDGIKEWIKTDENSNN